MWQSGAVTSRPSWKRRLACGNTEPKASLQEQETDVAEKEAVAGRDPGGGWIGAKKRPLNLVDGKGETQQQGCLFFAYLICRSARAAPVVATRSSRQCAERRYCPPESHLP